MAAKQPSDLTPLEAASLLEFADGAKRTVTDILRHWCLGAKSELDVTQVLDHLVQLDLLVRREDAYRITQSGSDALEALSVAPTDPPPHP